MPPCFNRPPQARRGWLTAAAVWLGALLVSCWVHPVQAQAWTAAPVPQVVPGSPGAAIDALARPCPRRPDHARQ